MAVRSWNPSTQEAEQKDGECEVSLSHLTNKEGAEGRKGETLYCSLLKHMLDNSVNNVIIT